MDMVDTSKTLGKGMLSMYQRLNWVVITGYMQPQFQVASEEGTRTYSGGDFPPHSNSRFMLRRGRVKLEYARFNDQNQPVVHFAFQFDGTERGVFIRDFFGQVFENKWQLFEFTTGMFARPYGFEVNLSSADREAPERGRMSQTLMKTERDLGAMVSFDPRARNNFLRYIKLDAGFFNGPGLSSPNDYDSYKDFISRLFIKPYPVAGNMWLSGGLSYYNGGLLQDNKYRYVVNNKGGIPVFALDSSDANINSKAPRKYHGGDVQYKIKTGWGFTELRGEYWQGTQTATFLTSETPAALLGPNQGHYIRNFNGAFFYFLQNIVNTHHQFAVKYDWYDPNSKVKGTQIDSANGFGPADIKYSTLGIGYIYYINENLKLMLWYDDVKNEKTSLAGFTEDVKDNVLTIRLQFRF